MSWRDRARRRPGRPRSGAALAILAGALLAVAPRSAARSGHTVVVRGTVTDESGRPVPGHTVRLLKSRTIVNLAGFKTQDQNVEEVRASTDAHGFFEFNFPVDPQFRYYSLRFYDPKSFDAVKYRLPEDRDISRTARQGRPVQATVVLKLQPDWPKVKALVDQYGPASHCGQIVRALGLPSRRTSQGEGRELWEYDEARVAYLVEGSKVLETRRLPSAASGAPAAGSAGQTPEDRPEPATRVEEP